jgi:hypothetical protein
MPRELAADAPEQLRCRLYLAGNAGKLHAAAKLIAAERRGDLSTGRDLLGYREDRRTLGGVARPSPSGSIARGRQRGCGGCLVFAAGHVGRTGGCLNRSGRCRALGCGPLLRTSLPFVGVAAVFPLVLRAGISSSWRLRATARWSRRI